MNRAILLTLLLLIAGMAMSCRTGPGATRLAWASDESLHKNAAAQVQGDWRNQGTNRYPGYTLWFAFDDRQSLPGDVVRLQTNYSNEVLTATLLRSGEEVYRVSHPFDDYGSFVKMKTQLRPRMKMFPLIWGWLPLRITLGRDDSGLVLQEIYGGGPMFLLVAPVSDDTTGDPDSFTFTSADPPIK